MNNNIDGLSEEQTEVWKALQQEPWDKVCEIIDEDLFNTVRELSLTYRDWLELSITQNKPLYQPPDSIIEIACKCNYDPVELSVIVFKTLVAHAHEIDLCNTTGSWATSKYLHLSEKLHREAINKLKEEANATK